jgi:hypothetical protein
MSRASGMTADKKVSWVLTSCMDKSLKASATSYAEPEAEGPGRLDSQTAF